MKILAIVEYLGTSYHGWQKQTNANSVQEEIEKVLSQILNEETQIYASGRTDAGVHAKGQTFHFEVNKEVDLSKLKYASNMLLPDDIHIKEMNEVDSDFHARYSAKEKHYQYLINVGDKNPFLLNRALYYPYPFSMEKLMKSLSLFIGEHNFQNFTSKEEDESGFVRNIYSINVIKENDIVRIDLVGNGFMRYMIRDIIGTCLAYASDKIDIHYIEEHLDSRLREIVSYKAGSEGLYLIDVIY